MKNEASHCLALLTRCRNAIAAGRWEYLAGLEQDYMAAFARLKGDMDDIGNGNDMPVTGKVPEEYTPVMLRLEQEQRHLVRLARRRQQVIQKQMGILNDAESRLQRMKRFSRKIVAEVAAA